MHIYALDESLQNWSIIIRSDVASRYADIDF